MKKNEIQEKIINSTNNLLVLASAGCGKTYTITKKIEYLLNFISPENILVISFTNETVNDLKSKLNKDINIFTFHKLAIKILKDSNINYLLTDEDMLTDLINNYFKDQITKKDKIKLMIYFIKFNYKDLMNSSIFLTFKRQIFTFIKLMQCNNYNFDFLKKTFITSKDKFLISIIMKIYLYYNIEKKNNNIMDLDDIIIKAAEITKDKKFNYKYIFVDEFQDTSEIRFNLIYNIYTNSNSIINFFGDDFQSIYAFTGCNIFIMLNIQDQIKNIELITLNKNFRSDNNLIQLANKFISKNPKQIPKYVSSDIIIKDSINYIYYKNINKTLTSLLSKLEKMTNDIMILGRYKSDLKNVSNKYKRLTIHESKGLEAKYVIVLGLKNDKYGLPSKIKNSSLLKHFDNNEPFPYAEERRIFYVAITRAKEKVFFIIPKNNPSEFITEFKKMKTSK